jgi:hypothetical protein
MLGYVAADACVHARWWQLEHGPLIAHIRS